MPSPEFIDPHVNDPIYKEATDHLRQFGPSDFDTVIETTLSLMKKAVYEKDGEPLSEYLDANPEIDILLTKRMVIRGREETYLTIARRLTMEQFLRDNDLKEV